MEVSLDDVPQLRGQSPRRREPLGRMKVPLGAMRRRTFLRGAAVAGAGIGMAALGLLPPLRRAQASHAPAYQIEPLPCYMSTWYQSHGGTCNRPCGMSTIYPGSCIDGDPDGHNYGFHRGPNQDWDLRPGECSTGSWDGWKWKVHEGCGVCDQNTVFRCHDGWNLQLNPNDKSVCKWRVNCDV